MNRLVGRIAPILMLNLRLLDNRITKNLLKMETIQSSLERSTHPVQVTVISEIPD